MELIEQCLAAGIAADPMLKTKTEKLTMNNLLAKDLPDLMDKEKRHASRELQRKYDQIAIHDFVYLVLYRVLSQSTTIGEKE